MGDPVDRLAGDLERLQRLTTVLSALTAETKALSLAQVEHLEDLAAQVSQLSTGLTFDLAQAAADNVKARKLSRDLAKLVMHVDQVLKHTQQISFEARYAIEKASEAAAPPPPSLQSLSRPLLRAAAPVDATADAKLSADVLSAVRLAEEKASRVNDLTSTVAGLVAASSEPVQKLSLQTAQSRSDVVSGLNELVELKKREAGKHVTRGASVSMVIGGTVGIIGGPVGIAIGVAAGAAVGAVVGSGITSLSRRSINREVRAFKDKFAQVQVQSDGTCISVLELWENQRWSMYAQTWSSANLLATDFVAKWTDDLGGLLDRDAPTPDRDAACPAPVLDRASLGGAMAAVASSQRDADDGGVDAGGMLEMEDAPGPRMGEDDNVYAGTWVWEGPWRLDQARKDSDAAGWSYSFSFGDGSAWTGAQQRSSLVRRRRWFRVRAMRAAHARNPDEVAQVEVHKARSGLRFEPDLSEDALRHVHNATRNVRQSLQAQAASLGEMRRQGLEVALAAEDAELVLDAARTAQRVERASTVTGAILNTITPTPARSVALKSERAVLEGAPAVPVVAEPASDASPLDALERLCAEQLRVSVALNEQVKMQARTLDGVGDTLEIGTERVRKLKV